MKRMFLFILLQIGFGLNAQLPGGSSKPSSNIQSLPPLSPAPTQAPQRPRQPYVKKALPQPVTRISTYFYPGIIVNRGGHWDGADHLLNISKQIGVFAEIVRPPNDSLNITQEQIVKEIESIFGQAGIGPVSLGPIDQPPLPAFQIKLFLYPLEGGYVAFCEGRLFESVILQRFNLDPNMAFQAITWERQSLILASKDQVIGNVTNQVKTIAQEFTEIYKSFELRKRLSP